MFDLFHEYSVKTRKSLGTTARIIITWAIGILIDAALLYLIKYTMGTVFPAVQVIAAAFVAYGTWWVAAWARKKEYEYSITNQFLTVDKIIANRKRYPVASIDLKTIESFGKFSPKGHDLSRYDKKVFAVGGDFDDYYITLHHQKHGHSILVISCDDELLEGILKMVPKEIARESGVKL